jgi:XRE family transcriptional regulator, aerobic/anaerobic benzoate catabolism transcriptional regulator
MSYPVRRRKATPQARLELPGELSGLAAILSEIGLRVRRTRQKRGLTRKQLAQRSGISLRYLAQLEGGNANVSVAVLWKVAGSLGVGLLEFIPETMEAAIHAEPLEHLLHRLSPRERQWAYELLLRNLGAVAERKCGIALVGLRGAGKSTLGRLLARHYGVSFLRLGDTIAEMGSMDISELFALGGQALYRRLEHQALQHVVLGHDIVVLEVGGSLVMQEMTHDLLLRSFRTIWVRASAEEHMHRVLKQGDLRPMAGNADAAMGDLRAILEQREPRFRLSDYTLDTRGRDIESCLGELLRVCAEVLGARATAQSTMA